MIDPKDWEGRIWVGDCLEFMRGLPEQSVNCCVTSPPYWGLRDYQTEGQIGLEPTPELYIEHMVEVFRGVRRVLRDDGTCWLVMGDSYAGSGGAGGDYNEGGLRAGQPRYKSSFRPGAGRADGIVDDRGQRNRNGVGIVPGLKPKDLCMIPARLALALQADGWWIRSDIIWAKPNPMPESCTDRPTSSHEHVFLLTKAARYWYDADAVREPNSKIGTAGHLKGGMGKRAGTREGLRGTVVGRKRDYEQVGHQAGHHGSYEHELGRNLRNVWTIATEPFPGAHFATYPTKLVAPCIKAGCPHKVCSECGSPWVRETERVGGAVSTVAGRGKTRPDHGPPGQGQYRYNAGMTVGGIYKTLGFKPTCSCGGETRPGLVLDPFAGSGTTGVVAIRHGRRFVGAEINPEYAAMAQERIDREREKLQLDFDQEAEA